MGLTNADLDAIEARLKAATPGPWTLIAYEHGGGRLVVEEPYTRVIATLVADLYETPGPSRDGNRTLLTHAPVDLAALVAEVRQLRAEVDAMCQNAPGDSPGCRYNP
jgi:hypothetical protein